MAAAYWGTRVDVREADQAGMLSTSLSSEMGVRRAGPCSGWGSSGSSLSSSSSSCVGSLDQNTFPRYQPGNTKQSPSKTHIIEVLCFGFHGGVNPHTPTLGQDVLDVMNPVGQSRVNQLRVSKVFKLNILDKRIPSLSLRIILIILLKSGEEFDVRCG